MYVCVPHSLLKTWSKFKHISIKKIRRTILNPNSNLEIRNMIFNAELLVDLPI